MVETSHKPDWHKGFVVNKEDLVVSQLMRLGVPPSEVKYVIATHFDGDHAGSLGAFTASEIVAQRRQFPGGAGRPPPGSPGRGTKWGNAQLKYQLINGDVTLLPGIEIIETSGHVAGHQSVLVRLPETGPVLLAIDA